MGTVKIRRGLVEGVDGFRMMFGAQAIAANMASYHSWYDVLPRISCPTLLLRSSSHETVPDADRERMKAPLPGGMARESSPPEHNVHLSDKEESYGFFDDFLAEVAP